MLSNWRERWKSVLIFENQPSFCGVPERLYSWFRTYDKLTLCTRTPRIHLSSWSYLVCWKIWLSSWFFLKKTNPGVNFRGLRSSVKPSLFRIQNKMNSSIKPQPQLLCRNARIQNHTIKIWTNTKLIPKIKYVRST